MTEATATTILIGDLLVRAEMTTPRDMADAVPISLKTGLPIGRVLIGAGGLTEAHLQQALLAQSLIRDSLLSVDLAVQALRIVVREGFNLEQALRIVGWQPDTFASENRLGQLLLAAGVIQQEELEEALKVFYTAGLPLARVLVLRGSITNIVAYAALSSQQLLRENKLTRDQAVQCVRAAAQSRATIEDNYVNGYLRMQPSNNVRLGELLVLANMATELDVMQAVEWAIKRGETLGEVLVAHGTVHEDEIKRALEAQRLVTKGLLDSAKAGDVLKKANYERISITDALSSHAPARLVRVMQEQVESSNEPAKETKGWLEEMQQTAKSTKQKLQQQRTDQETRARQLSSRLIDKIEASYTRNVYLKNILVDKEHKDDGKREREELQGLKDELENIADFDGCMELIDKLIAKIETFSYHNGYLRSRLDTISAQLELAERVREAEETAQAWRDRANSAVEHRQPAVIVRQENEDAIHESKEQEALVSKLTDVASNVASKEPETFIMAQDVTAMVSSTVPVSTKTQSVKPSVTKPQKKTPRGGKKRR